MSPQKMVLSRVLCFLALVLAAGNTINVTIYRNGGPVDVFDTGVTVEVEGASDLEPLRRLVEEGNLSQRLGLWGDEDLCVPLKFYSHTGRPLTNTRSLKARFPVFALPAIPQHFAGAAGNRWLYEPFVWPAMRPGHRTILPVRNAAGDFLVMETISMRPRLFVIDDFLSQHECDLLKWYGNNFGEWEYASTMREGDAPDPMVGSARTNRHAWIARDMRDVPPSVHEIGVRLKAIDERIAALTGIDDLELHENIQLVHYRNASEYYWAHHDYLNNRALHTHLGSNRLVTLFFYLNSLSSADGGETNFLVAGNSPYGPNVTREHWGDCAHGLKVTPKMGRAAFWYNLDAYAKGGVMAGVGDPWTRHGGCPPRNQEKWGANRWVWNWVPLGATRYTGADSQAGH